MLVQHFETSYKTQLLTAMSDERLPNAVDPLLKSLKLVNAARILHAENDDSELPHTVVYAVA